MGQLRPWPCLLCMCSKCEWWWKAGTAGLYTLTAGSTAVIWLSLPPLLPGEWLHPFPLPCLVSTPCSSRSWIMTQTLTTWAPCLAPPAQGRKVRQRSMKQRSSATSGVVAWDRGTCRGDRWKCRYSVTYEGVNNSLCRCLYSYSIFHFSLTSLSLSLSLFLPPSLSPYLLPSFSSFFLLMEEGREERKEEGRREGGKEKEKLTSTQLPSAWYLATSNTLPEPIASFLPSHFLTVIFLSIYTCLDMTSPLIFPLFSLKSLTCRLGWWQWRSSSVCVTLDCT